MRHPLALLLLLLLLLAAACGDDSSIDAGPDSDFDANIDPEDASLADAGLRDAGAPGPFIEDERWFRHGTFYELWVRSFQDSDGDGVGDFSGLTSRLDYLQDLGVTGLWLMPFFPSPLVDSGYDVADYVDVHEDYGTLDDFQTFLDAAHERELRVLVDLVFNHTSDEHPWFLDSRANPDGERGDWFVWADTEGENCDSFSGVFGVDRWTRDDVRGQFFFHQFYSRQPDLNFESEAVQDALLDVARFWLERGVDGFRLDVPYRYFEDLPVCEHEPGTFAFLRRLRALTDEYDAVMVGEILAGGAVFDQYLEPDVLQMSFALTDLIGVQLLASTGDPGAYLAGSALKDQTRVEGGGTFATLLGNHDVVRVSNTNQDPASLAVLATTQLTLPGVPFVYYGEELGMLDGPDVIVDSRDSARTPMQWDDSPNAGFTVGTPFLALAPESDRRNVEALSGSDGLLAHYRALIALRASHRALTTGSFLRVPGFAGAAYWRSHPEDGDLLVVINYGDLARPLAVPSRGGAASDVLSGLPVGEVNDGVFRADVPPKTGWVVRFDP